MSGPIVRSGASPEFSKNWDRIFGGKKAAKAAGSTATAVKKTGKSGKKAKPAPAPKKKAAKKKS